MKLTHGSFAKRAVMVGLLAGSSMLAVSAFAVPASGSANMESCEAMHGGMDHAKQEAFRAKHMAELKTKLKLKPEQEAAWNVYAKASESGMRAMDMDKQDQRSEFAKLNTPQRLDKMLAMSDARHAKMVERIKVIKTFYAQLTPEQQAVFDAEAMAGHKMGQHHHKP